MNLKHLIVALAGGIIPSVAACSSAPTARRYDAVMAGKSGRTAVEIHGVVASACGLDYGRAYFDYGSDGLDAHDKDVIDDIAECLRSGRLAGRSVLVTGFTDMTGTRPDNRDLGWARSEAVAEELYANGIPPNRIYVRSLGERKAKGQTPEGMAYDRRVELKLVERD